MNLRRLAALAKAVPFQDQPPFGWMNYMGQIIITVNLITFTFGASLVRSL